MAFYILTRMNGDWKIFNFNLNSHKTLILQRCHSTSVKGYARHELTPNIKNIWKLSIDEICLFGCNIQGEMGFQKNAQ